MIRTGCLPESFGAALHTVLPGYFSPDRGWKVRAEKSPDDSNFIRTEPDGGATVFMDLSVNWQSRWATSFAAIFLPLRGGTHFPSAE